MSPSAAAVIEVSSEGQSVADHVKQHLLIVHNENIALGSSVIVESIRSIVVRPGSPSTNISATAQLCIEECRPVCDPQQLGVHGGSQFTLGNKTRVAVGFVEES